MAGNRMGRVPCHTAEKHCRQRVRMLPVDPRPTLHTAMDHIHRRRRTRRRVNPHRVARFRMRHRLRRRWPRRTPVAVRTVVTMEGLRMVEVTTRRLMLRATNIHQGTL
ncbi:hypothetical protein GCM10009632_38960 [Mycolicibacterium alvei]|uniref:Uncharacterized protein n=1 Tax=Mycolicibacterium alvei TaxID=67081 RepID=A0A6N4UU46_9MYCO|nr:hypothetical protein MALV_25800 [Mycolicibacterium alvei]